MASPRELRVLLVDTTTVERRATGGITLGG
jgi:hypothetical protein